MAHFKLSRKEWLPAVAIGISVVALLSSFVSNKIAYDAKDAEFGTKFSVSCNFGEERGYILQDKELTAPILCKVSNNSSTRMITLVDFMSAITSKRHGPTSLNLSLASDAQESFKLSILPGGVEDVHLVGKLTASNAVLHGCTDGSNMTGRELLRCADEKITSTPEFLSKISTYKLDNPQVKIKFSTSDRLIQSGDLELPFVTGL